jgi:hypothetical protein
MNKELATVATHNASKEYLDLLARAVSNYLYLGEGQCEYTYPSREAHHTADGWKLPEYARPHTTARIINLNNLHTLAVDVIQRKVPGDFLEAGVWQGGAVIFLAGLVKAYNVQNVRVWAADTFAGIPDYKVDGVNDVVEQWTDRWVASLSRVKDNIRRYNLLDDKIRFVEGPFRDALPAAGIERLSLLRVDGDSYASTRDALQALYGKVSPGGYVIVVNWHLGGCRDAVLAFRDHCDNVAPLQGVYTEGDDDEPYEVFWEA